MGAKGGGQCVVFEIGERAIAGRRLCESFPTLIRVRRAPPLSGRAPLHYMHPHSHRDERRRPTDAYNATTTQRESARLRLKCLLAVAIHHVKRKAEKIERGVGGGKYTGDAQQERGCCTLLSLSMARINGCHRIAASTARMHPSATTLARHTMTSRAR